jgi:tetratricopeptide (TPR) repeat protein
MFTPFIAMTGAYLAVRMTVFKDILPEASTTALERLPGFFVAVTHYIRLLLLPVDLHMEYGNRLFHCMHPHAAIGLVIVILAIGYALIRRAHAPVVFFSILWFSITLLPASNMYPLNAYMAEHWLYVPSLGFFILVATGFRYLYHVRRNVAIMALGVIAICYTYLTVQQNGYWARPIPFYTRTLHYAPRSFRVHNALGVAYQDAGRIDEAITSFKKALSYNPQYAKPYDNLAYLYSAIGKEEEAIASYKKVIELAPTYVDAYNNLGTIYATRGRTKEAEGSFKKAVELDPRYAEAHINLSILYFQQKQYALAIDHCDRARTLGIVKPALMRALEPYRMQE